MIEVLRKEREREKILLEQRSESERVQPAYFEEGHYFAICDANLDKAEFGPRWLVQPEIADIIREAMHYRDAKVFDLHAFCVMPNHVHVVFEPLSRAECYSALSSEYHSELPKIMQSLKRHTARQANKILGGGRVLAGRKL